MAETGNKASAAQGLASEGNRYFDLITDVNDTLFNAGKVERDAEQERSDAMRAFQEAIKNKKYDDALKLLGAAQGSPYSSTTTSQQKQTADPMGIFGSILSALFA
jgi:hypothetical protein